MFDANPFIGVVIFICSCMVYMLWIDVKPIKRIIFRIWFGVWPSNPKANDHAKQKLIWVRKILMDMTNNPEKSIYNEDLNDHAYLSKRNNKLTELAKEFGIKF